ncbi:hypothetical protein GCM10012285_12830 [Streptomyces kronopolitis]|uniref:Uncharacterized protein n=1 Tax=Streptomyces kronopolitis TaxID=1612435 RepID=A0ABQ2J320_9ACTN|nr:hypothetical protein GCM10012285_12830 [Streptomyces kronopolitis]
MAAVVSPYSAGRHTAHALGRRVRAELTAGKYLVRRVLGGLRPEYAEETGSISRTGSLAGAVSGERRHRAVDEAPGAGPRRDRDHRPYDDKL